MIETFNNRKRELSTDLLEIITEYSRMDRAAERWSILRRRARLEYAPESFEEMAKGIKEFAGPVKEAVEQGRPSPGKWNPAGPWHD